MRHAENDAVIDDVVAVMAIRLADNDIENTRKQADAIVRQVEAALLARQQLEPPLALALDADGFLASAFVYYSPEAYARLVAMAAIEPSGVITKLWGAPATSGAERAGIVEVLRKLCHRLASNDWKDDEHLADVMEAHLSAPVDVVVDGYRIMAAALKEIRDYPAPETTAETYTGYDVTQTIAEAAHVKVQELLAGVRADADHPTVES